MSCDLQERLDAHWAACKTLLDSKKWRIREFCEERSRREAELVESLSKHDTDMQKMTDLFHKKMKCLKTDLQRELVNFEKNLAEQRIEANVFYRSEIDRLFEERLRAEKSEFVEQTQREGKRFHKCLISLHRELQKSSQENRSSLTASLNELEIRSEKLRVEQMISQEQVDERLWTLKNKANEQESIDRRSKGEIVRLREARNRLAEETQASFDLANTINKRLCKDICKITRNYNILMEKYRNIEKINDAKYMRVFQSNEREMEHLSEKLISRIRSIFKNVVNADWNPPEFFDDGKSETGTYSKTAESSISELKKNQQQKSRFSNSKIKSVIDLVICQLGYLREAAGVVGIQSILNQIGCASVADLDLLVSIFFAGQDDDDEALCRGESDVLDLVREFIKEKEDRRVAEAAMGKRRNKAKDDRKMQERIRKEEDKHWRKLGSPVSGETIKELEEILNNLKDRLDLFQREKILRLEGVNLKRENVHLKSQIQ